MAFGVEANPFGPKGHTERKRHLVTKAARALRLGQIRAREALDRRAEFGAEHAVQRDRGPLVLGEHARLAGDRALAHERRLIARRHGEALVQGEREAAVFAARGLDDGGFEDKAQIAERVARSHVIAEGARRRGARLRARLIEHERQIDADQEAIEEPHPGDEIPHELMTQHLERDVAFGGVAKGDGPIRIRHLEARVPLAGPGRARRLDVHARAGRDGRAIAAQIERGDRVGVGRRRCGRDREGDRGEGGKGAASHDRREGRSRALPEGILFTKRCADAGWARPRRRARRRPCRPRRRRSST